MHSKLPSRVHLRWRTQRVAAAIVFGCLLAALAMIPIAEAAVPVIYHSPADDGAPAPLLFEIGPAIPTTLHLYIDGGSSPSPGDVCDLGIGDELCAWDIIVEGKSGLDLVSFTGAGDVVSHLSGATLRFNGGDPIAGTLGPVKLGDVVVQGIIGGILELQGTSKVVNTALGVDSLATATLVTVPEPGMALSLLAGTLFLYLSNARRRYDTH